MDKFYSIYQLIPLSVIRLGGANCNLNSSDYFVKAENNRKRFIRYQALFMFCFICSSIISQLFVIRDIRQVFAKHGIFACYKCRHRLILIAMGILTLKHWYGVHFLLYVTFVRFLLSRGYSLL